MASFSNIFSIVAVCCCLVVSLVVSAPMSETNVSQTNCSSLDVAGDIKRIIVMAENQAPLRFKKGLSKSDRQVLRKAVVSMNDLFERHATVSQLLSEEEENASDQTKALGLVLNKTIELTCKWLSEQFTSLELDCSSPQDTKISMLRISVNLLAQDFRGIMGTFNETRKTQRTSCDKWIECHTEQGSDRQLLTQLC